MNKTIAVIFALGFLLRLFIFIAAYDVIPESGIGWGSGDSHGYHLYALNFLENRIMEKNGHPSSLRTPAFPFFLACIYKIAGINVRLAVFVNILVAMGSALIFYWIGKRFLSERFLPLLAVLLMIEPVSLGLAFKLFHETFFVFLLALTFLFLLWGSEKEKDLLNIFLCGLLLGISILCRPVAQFLVVLIPLWILYQSGIRYQSFKKIATFVVGTLIVLMPWVVRNAKTFGIPMISSAGNYHFIYNIAAGTMVQVEGINFFKARKVFKEKLQNSIEEKQANTYVDQFHLSNQIAKNYILSHPFALLKSTLGGLYVTTLGSARIHYDFLFPELARKGSNLMEIIRSPDQGLNIQIPIDLFIVLGIEILFFLFLYTGMVYGTYRAWRLNNHYIVLLCIMVVYFLLIAATPNADSRYRLPAMPFLIVTACYGWNQFFEWYRNRTTQHVPPSTSE